MTINLHPFALCACGIIAYVTANLFHELIGHGLTSLLLGNDITLLSSVYFRSSPHSFVTDVFGPLMNLAGGIIFFLALKRFNKVPLYIRLILLLATAFNLFFFSWLCLYSGITNTGDLAFAISGGTSVLMWRVIMITGGILAYYFSFIVILQSAREVFIGAGQSYSQKFLNRLFLIPFLSAGGTALIAVSFFKPLSFDNFYEAFTLPMFLPMLFIPGYLKAQSEPVNSLASSKGFQLSIIGFGLVLLIAFCFTMGKGMRF